MDLVTFDPLPFTLNGDELLKTLHVRAGSGHEAEVHRLIADVAAIAAPKATYRLAFIEDKGPDFVIAGGRKFTSRVLRVNLDTAQRVFAFVCTAGREVAAWAQGQEDLLAQYYADAISEAVLYSARQAFLARLKELHALAGTSEMHPGSLPDWPLGQQRVLFDLLGDVHGAIGVELLPSMLMAPAKTVSGVIFPSEETFASCQLCPRGDCPNRRAAYDVGLFERKFAKAGS